MPSVTLPTYRADRFNCPHCGALSHHDWHVLNWARKEDDTLVGVMSGLTKLKDEFTASLCLSCNRIAVWHRLDVGVLAAKAAQQRQKLMLPSATAPVIHATHRMIWPRSDGSVEPLPDAAPDLVRDLWDEARQVAALSPRSAAALLRLALQLLLHEIEPEHKTIDRAIAAAFANNTPETIVKAMDYVRVTGNQAVHDGQVQMNEDPDVIPALFGLLRYIVDVTLVREAQVNKLFATLPADKQAGIAQRNARAKP